MSASPRAGGSWHALHASRVHRRLMARYFDVRNTVLLVVGYGILAEEEDRPVAYQLKEAIATRGRGSEHRRAVVVTDMWMLNQEMADLFPAVAVGGPAVNAFAAQIYEQLPVAFTRDDQVFIQMDQERGKRAAIWGMDGPATREAGQRFVREGFLDRFLALTWRQEV